MDLAKFQSLVIFLMFFKSSCSEIEDIKALKILIQRYSPIHDIIRKNERTQIKIVGEKSRSIDSNSDKIVGKSCGVLSKAMAQTGISEEGFIVFCVPISSFSVEEEIFFQAVKRIAAFFRIDRLDNELYVYFFGAQMAETDFNELISLISGFNIDVLQLLQFVK